MKTPQWRKVADVLYYRTLSHPTGTSSKELVLECGHSAFRKGSEPTPGRCRCRECEMNRNHKTITREKT